MSKGYDLREALRDSIVAADIGLAADDIVIERQADIISEINNKVSLATNGVVLVIGASDKENLAPRLLSPRWELTLRLSLWVLPIYDQENMPEEDIGEALENHLSQLSLNPDSPHACKEAFRLTTCRDIPDPDYLVRELVIETILQN